MNGLLNCCLEDGFSVEHSNGTEVHEHFLTFIFYSKSTRPLPQNSSLSIPSALVSSNRMVSLLFLDKTQK